MPELDEEDDEILWQELEDEGAEEERRFVDAFVKIDGIESESEDSKHKNEVEILGWRGRVTQPGSAQHGGGAGAGRSVHHGFKFVKLVDKATPKLLAACATGEHIKKAEFAFRKAGKEQQEYCKITFSDVILSHFRFFHKGDPITSLPRDGFELSYGKIEMEYKEQKADGTLGGAVKGGYDVKARKEV